MIGLLDRRETFFCVDVGATGIGDNCGFLAGGVFRCALVSVRTVEGVCVVAGDMIRRKKFEDIAKSWWWWREMKRVNACARTPCGGVARFGSQITIGNDSSLQRKISRYLRNLVSSLLSLSLQTDQKYTP